MVKAPNNLFPLLLHKMPLQKLGKVVLAQMLMLLLEDSTRWKQHSYVLTNKENSLLLRRSAYGWVEGGEGRSDGSRGGEGWREHRMHKVRGSDTLQ